LSGEAVSLRARLTLFFVAIVVLPVALATAYGWQAVARSTSAGPDRAARLAARWSCRSSRSPGTQGSGSACWPSCCSGWWSASWPGPSSVWGVELGEYLTALRSSRDELACSMNRLGETLSSTHDLPKLLAVVLEAAVQARRAKAGSLLLLTADRTALAREATHGLAHRDTAERIPVGQGVAGTVAATGRRAVHPGRRRGPLRGQVPGPGPVVTAGHRLLPLTARPGQAGAGRPGTSRIAV
jgi:hypothetical protein